MKHPLLFTVLSSTVCVTTATTTNKTPENTTPTKSKAPNVVFIYADDLGYGDLQCYGAKNVETPNVNRLAKSGILFTNAHATAATSTPSRYSMLTGEYAWRKKGTDVAAGNAGMIIRPEQYTMADMFKSTGYTTAAVGKWHLGLGRQGGNTGLERSPALRTGRFGLRLPLHHGCHSRPRSLRVHRKRESSQLRPQRPYRGELPEEL